METTFELPTKHRIYRFGLLINPTSTTISMSHADFLLDMLFCDDLQYKHNYTFTSINQPRQIQQFFKASFSLPVRHLHFDSSLVVALLSMVDSVRKNESSKKLPKMFR